MSNYKNNYNNDTPTAFLVPHEDKNGETYWKGTMDLGGGKAVKLVMFQNQKEGTKSDFIVNGHKKRYDLKKKTNASW